MTTQYPLYTELPQLHSSGFASKAEIGGGLMSQPSNQRETFGSNSRFAPLGNVVYLKTVLANVARVNIAARAFGRSLKYRFLLKLVALNTKPMYWFGRGFIFLQKVHTNPLPNRVKRIFCCCSRPCFFLHQLFFQIVFFSQQRLMLLLESEDRVLKVDDRKV